MSVVLFVLAVSAFGQRSLEIKDVTEGLKVFSGKDTEAGMVFSCPSSIPLTFESTHDKVVDVYNKEIKGKIPIIIYVFRRARNIVAVS